MARIRARRRRPRRADRDDRARAGAHDGVAMTARVDGIVDAHDRVAAAEQRHAGRHAGLQSFERRQMRFGFPERLVRAARVDRLGRGRPCVAVRAADRAQHRMARMRMRVDQARQHGLAVRVDRACRAVARVQRVGVADGDDALALHGDRAVLDHAPLRIERDHATVRDQHVDRFAMVVDSHDLRSWCGSGSMESGRATKPDSKKLAPVMRIRPSSRRARAACAAPR
ncbi:hypothetical protein FEQ01_06616 [Burkholderia pseudomultivorans]|nr:hypothetical protein [Burkholderia pseudomultivorans]